MNVIIVQAIISVSIDTHGLKLGLKAKERDPVTIFDPRFDPAALAGIDNIGQQWK